MYLGLSSFFYFSPQKKRNWFRQKVIARFFFVLCAKKIRHSSISHPKCHSKGSSEGIKDEVYKCEHHRQNAQNTRQNSIGNCTK